MDDHATLNNHEKDDRETDQDLSTIYRGIFSGTPRASVHTRIFSRRR